MKRLAAVFLFLATFLCPGPSQPARAQQPTAQVSQDPLSVTVYITKTGRKYHRDGCRYLRQSRITITLKDAKANGYTPCSVCKPPRWMQNEG
jgi:competence protein ComEC